MVCCGEDADNANFEEVWKILEFFSLSREIKQYNNNNKNSSIYTIKENEIKTQKLTIRGWNKQTNRNRKVWETLIEAEAHGFLHIWV